jgi:hypothetical protein
VTHFWLVRYCRCCSVGAGFAQDDSVRNSKNSHTLTEQTKGCKDLILNISSCTRIPRFLGVDFVHLLVENVLRSRYYYKQCLKYPAGNTNIISNILIHYIYISIEYFSRYCYQMASLLLRKLFTIPQRFNNSVHSITTYVTLDTVSIQLVYWTLPNGHRLWMLRISHWCRLFWDMMLHTVTCQKNGNMKSRFKMS